MMHGSGKSDRPVVPTKSPNKPGFPAAEEMEGRGLAKGSLQQQNTLRIQGRERVQSALGRVRQAARKDRKNRLTALYHHIHSTDTLREAFYRLKRDAAPGTDEETWWHYGLNLESNLQNLSQRLRGGTYQAKPVRRVYIPKADGRQRPLGVTALEDKLVQRATVEVLNAVYEIEFLGFSYGFRPARSQHLALDALAVGLTTKKVSWVLDADIRGFFDAIDHGWLVKFIEHRIGDRRVVRLIRKWLNAGVLENGTVSRSEAGTPQGGSASPLLANVYLHYAFDLWTQQWRRMQARGDVIVVRWADDFIVGFQYQSDAEQFLSDLTERFAKFELELHPDKTRLVEFGRFAALNREQRGEGRPQTFEFLGFTHISGKTRKGRFAVVRHTSKKRFRRKLLEVKETLRRRMHDAVPEVGKWLASVVRGHVQYYGVPLNYRALAAFRFQVARLWRQALQRRSQRVKTTWDRMQRLATKWLPLPRIVHPYPLERLGVITQGRSRMR